MLVLAVGKQRGICLNPDIRLFNATTGAEAGFTGMHHLLLILAIFALVVVKAHLLRAAFEHFLHIAGDTGTLDLCLMEFGKGVVPLPKDLF